MGWGGSSTWLVQTLLKATNANVCASIVLGRSFFARARGMMMALRASCGMKARDSKWSFEGEEEEERWRRML